MQSKNPKTISEYVVISEELDRRIEKYYQAEMQYLTENNLKLAYLQKIKREELEAVLEVVASAYSPTLFGKTE